MEVEKMDENEWKYHGEGNQSLVVSHCQVGMRWRRAGAPPPPRRARGRGRRPRPRPPFRGWGRGLVRPRTEPGPARRLPGRAPPGARASPSAGAAARPRRLPRLSFPKRFSIAVAGCLRSGGSVSGNRARRRGEVSRRSPWGCLTGCGGLAAVGGQAAGDWTAAVRKREP